MPYRKNPLTANELREQAKARMVGLGISDDRALTLPQVQGLFEQLEVRQIELELQNEHLNTARAQLEAALNQSSELYDFSPVGSLSIDSTGSIIKLNLAAARLLGGERARLLGSKLGLYVSEQDRLLFNGLLERAATSGDVQSVELTLTTGGTLLQYVAMRVASFQPERGWHVILIDIHERRRHEEQLRASEERWKMALDAAGDGVWDWNVQTGTVVFSRRFEQLYGFAENSYGITLEDWSTRIHPEDRPRVLADLQDYWRGTTASYASEHRGLCKDGNWRWVLARGAIVSRTREGRPLRMVGTHVDISTQKEMEQTMLQASQFQQALFDALNALIVVLDQSGAIVQTNVAWQEHVFAAGGAQRVGSSGCNYLEVLDQISAGDKKTVLAARSGIASVLSGAAPGFALAEPFFSPLNKCWLSMKVTAMNYADKRIVVSHENVSSTTSTACGR